MNTCRMHLRVAILDYTRLMGVVIDLVYKFSSYILIKQGHQGYRISTQCIKIHKTTKNFSAALQYRTSEMNLHMYRASLRRG